jgi:hypothetical protein
MGLLSPVPQQEATRTIAGIPGGLGGRKRRGQGWRNRGWVKGAVILERVLEGWDLQDK